MGVEVDVPVRHRWHWISVMDHLRATDTSRAAGSRPFEENPRHSRSVDRWHVMGNR